MLHNIEDRLNQLGQVDGFFSAGELMFLWRRGLIEGRLCGCGLPVRDCDVWTGVLDRAYPAGVDAHASRSRMKRSQSIASGGPSRSGVG